MAETNPSAIWESVGWTSDAVPDSVDIDDADYLDYLDEVLDGWLDEFEFGPYE